MLSTLERQFNLSECYHNKKEIILKNDLFLVWINKRSIKIVTYRDDDLVINSIRSTIDSMVTR